MSDQSVNQVELFHVAPQKPPVCPVCNQPIRWMTVQNSIFTREVAVNSLPVPASIASYRELDDQPGQVELVHRLRPGLPGTYYVSHEATCTRSPF